MAEKLEQIGTCRFCGQTRVIETLKELTQLELDEAATENCICEGAIEDKRKRARRTKINEFVNRKFGENKLADSIRSLADLVEDGTFEEVTFKLYKDKIVRIWKDSEFNIYIRIKRTEQDELKA